MLDSSTPTTPLRPVDLRTEQQISPLGIDERQPLLSWKLTGTGRGRFQTAHRIRVVVDGPGADPAAEAGAAAWDSGDVESPDSTGIAYAGTALRSRTRYRWTVRVHDEAGRDSGWSEPAEFETGLFSDTEWEASWITGPAEAELRKTPSLDQIGPHAQLERTWLPSATGVPSGDTAHFRGPFDVADADAVERVRLIAAGADEIRAWLNGHPLKLDEPAAPDAVRRGTNVLAVAARTEGEPRGLVARLDLLGADGPTATVVADGTWTANATGEAGWEGADFDDRHWLLAETYGMHGIPPSGREPRTYRPSPYLRKEFVAAGRVIRARLYTSALGLYEVRLNGQRVGDHRLAPGWTDYHTRVPYQTYDVTDLLVGGPNVIAALLGDGWYAGHVGWFGTGHYGEERLFIGRLEIEDADGAVTVVTTDATWRVGEGEIRFADLQNGEVVDARREPHGWDRPGFDDSGWAAAAVREPRHGPLEAAVAPPIRIEHELAPIAITRTPSGTQLVDFGQNLVGWVRLRLRGAAGTHVLLRYAEVLDHRGELYTEALRGARVTDEYYLHGAEDGEVFEPRFTVHGFRYVAIHGYPGALSEADISAPVVYAAMDRTGSFSCSDERLNKFAENIVWGQRGNFLSVPTDCPQRDERLGWTGDAQAFASTAAFNYDVRTFLRKWLRDLRDAQFDDGAVPHVAPDVISADGRPAAGAAGWGDAIAIVPWELFSAYGDHRALVENYRAVTAWLGYLEQHSKGYIRPDAGFADWLALMPTPRALVQTAFFAYAARLAEQIAAQLGRTEDEQRWRELYEHVRAAYRRKFVRGGGRVVSGTQTAYVSSLQFGLLEPDEEPRAAAHLVDEIASRNWHLSTGFLGAPYLLPVLERYGYEDVAFRLLMQDSYPSWLYPVVYGDATTVWERWDSWSDSRGFQDPGMTSFNHYAYGAVGQWMYRVLGGIAPAAPGYERVLVRPRPGGGVSSAQSSLETVRGPVSTRWQLTDGTFTLDVEIPPNSGAEVWLPAGAESAVAESGNELAVADVEAVEVVDGAIVVRIGSGTYQFSTAVASA